MNIVTVYDDDGQLARRVALSSSKGPVCFGIGDFALTVELHHVCTVTKCKEGHCQGMCAVADDRARESCRQPCRVRQRR